MRNVKLLAAIAVPVMLAVSAPHAAQQSYPDRPIRLVIGNIVALATEGIDRINGVTLDPG